VPWEGERALRRENRFRHTLLGRVPVPLPRNFVLGLDSQVWDNERGYPAFLAGELKHGGWWYYYLVAAALKLPLALLLLGLVAAVAALGGRGQRFGPDELLVALPALAIFLLISSQTGINLGFRYVLPCLPFLVVFLSRTARLPGALGWVVPAAAAGWLALSSLSAYPHSIGYFNEIAGGAEHGHDLLLESNVDWGQDLLFLREWAEQKAPGRQLRLACWTRCDPAVIGLDFPFAPLGPDDRVRSGFQRGDEYLGPQPGLFAVSVNLLHGLPMSFLSAKRGSYYAPPGAYTYFQQFVPSARVGSSILIYEISLDEANAVRRKLGLPPLPAASTKR
jgi:hypothetical protein